MDENLKATKASTKTKQTTQDMLKRQSEYLFQDEEGEEQQAYNRMDEMLRKLNIGDDNLNLTDQEKVQLNKFIASQ